jgi:hypothetical protein
MASEFAAFSLNPSSERLKSLLLLDFLLNSQLPQKGVEALLSPEGSIQHTGVEALAGFPPKGSTPCNQDLEYKFRLKSPFLIQIPVRTSIFPLR